MPSQDHGGITEKITCRTNNCRVRPSQGLLAVYSTNTITDISFLFLEVNPAHRVMSLEDNPGRKSPRVARQVIRLQEIYQSRYFYGEKVSFYTPYGSPVDGVYEKA